MSEIAFNYEDLWYIRTRGPDDKRPEQKWGGYNQDFDAASKVYGHEDVAQFPKEDWAVCGIRDTDKVTRSLLVFDLDIHKAGPEFNPNDLTVDPDVPLVKSQSGGFHAYFFVHAERGVGAEDEFAVPHDLSWDVDIRGSYVSHHVVAPEDIPGVGGSYSLVKDTTIPGVFDPADAVEKISYQGEPLLEYSPGGSRSSADIDFNRPEDAPSDMPKCYHRGLQLREAAPDDPDYNSHRVNVLTALCGLAAGYTVDEMVTHFAEEYPPGGDASDADREQTEYQLEHIASGMDNGDYAPPAEQTLREAGILQGTEGCDCSITFHGGEAEDGGLSDAAIWEWWADERAHGDLDEDSVVPTGALRHIVREHTQYDLDLVPDDVDGLPWRPHNMALSWLLYNWAGDALGLDAHDDDTGLEDVTARSYASHDSGEAYTWDAVRRIYSESKEDGRYAAVSLLRERHEFLTPEDTEELHIYNEDLGIYEIGANHDVGRALDRNLKSHYSTHEKNEIISRLKEVKVPRDELEAQRFDGTYVCVENGVLDVHTRELHDHDPKWLFTRRLPVEYDPDADCPEIRHFLQDITRREADWRTMVEMVGNALLPHYDYESFMVLFGRGANGKSTWLNVVREFLGRENIENIPLQDLSDNRFAPAQLVGKWANIGGDLPEKKIHDMGPLKDLTGGGEVWAEKKGEDGFNFENRAKLMFAANEPPVLGERNHAVARRILPIRLPHRYTPDPDDEHKDRIDDLEDDLTADDELSGLLNLALDGIDRLTDNSDFSLPESPAERLEYYEQFSDHIKMFAVNCLENESGAEEAKSDVYNAYTEFCSEKGREAASRQTFWDQLRKTTLDISISRPQREDGSRPRVVDNLTFTDHGQQFAPHYEADEDDAPTLSSIAPGDFGVTVEGRVEEVNTDVPDQIAEKATLTDVTDQVTVTVWAESNKPALEAGQAYRFKNVQVTDYDGHREIQVDENSGIEEIAAGVGNAPAADPGNNQQLDDGAATATDGGKGTDAASVDQPPGSGDITQLAPRVVMAVRRLEKDHPEGVPRSEIVVTLAGEGEDPANIQEAIEEAKKNGELTEPRTEHLRST